MISTYEQLCPVMFGVGAVNEIGKQVSEFGGSKVFCIYDKGVADSGIAGRVITILEDAGLETVSFDGVLPDAPKTMKEKAGKLARTSHAGKIDFSGFQN